MTEQDFSFVSRILRDKTGISLSSGKEYLVETRLINVSRKMGLGSVTEFIQQLRTQCTPKLVSELTEAMVTNETSFYRDILPFDLLRSTVIPELMAARRGPRGLSIWCAACSTGQEPHSIAILLREYFPELINWRVTILATDISAEMVNRCRTGRYSQLEISRGLPPNLLAKYFQTDGESWVLSPKIRGMIDVRVVNLIEDWPSVGQFDLVFLRNVMIYFDLDVKKTILQRMANIVRPDGYLVLGAAETMLGIEGSFTRAENLNAGYHRVVRPSSTAVVS
jgi:chemotaxis protein methyltransferase CheR